MPRALLLEDRGVIAVGGADAAEFLNGLVTNDVAKAAPGHAVYAALLTPQGKYLFDFFLYRRAEEFLLDAGRARLPDLIKRLTMYKLRAKVTIADRSADLSVFAFDAPAGLPGAAPDPRDPSLGWRAILDHDPGLPAWPRADYRRRLLDHVVPDHERDLVPDETFPMDVQFDRLNGIDFKKGCYVGQELTARMKHRGAARKALLRVRFDGPLPAAATPILADAKEIGTLASGFENRALAVIRMDKLGDGGTLTAAGERLEIDP